MGSIISKWVWPLIITTIVGTIATLFLTQSTIEKDLTDRSMAAISAATDQGSGWATLTFNARDGILSGTTTDPKSVDGLVQTIASLHGVRSINRNGVIVAPTASPYDFKAVLSRGTIALSGAVPSLSMRDQLLDITGASDAGLELRTGVPENWLDATGFAVSRLNGLESGQASLADLSLSVTGTAETPQSYVLALSGLDGDLPFGMTLANIDIIPALVQDYAFDATRTDGTYAVSGFVPDEGTRTSIAELTGADISELLIARGAPENFKDNVTFGLAALGHMSNGNMKVEGSDLTISGTAASQLDFSALSTMAGTVPEGVSASFARLNPAIADPYFWSVQKRNDGTLTMRGYVPDDSARALVMARAGNDANDQMQLAAGAPRTFPSDSLAAIAAVKNLETGRAGFSRNIWFVEGQPTTKRAISAVTTALSDAATGSDQWRVSLKDVPQHPVSAFRWSADKFANGMLVLNGNVPDEATRTDLLERAGSNVTDLMQIAQDAPDHFHEDALVAISALNELDTGRTGVSTDGWFLNGHPAPGMTHDKVVNILVTAHTPKDQWNLAIAEAPATEPAPAAQAGPVQNATDQAPPQPEAAVLPFEPVTPVTACRNILNAFNKEVTIRFTSASAIMDRESIAALRSLATWLQRCPHVRISVAGHADSQDNAASNLRLSADRATAVEIALIKFGVNKNRLHSQGFGDSQPITTNDTAQGRQANRRIILSILQ